MQARLNGWVVSVAYTAHFNCSERDSIAPFIISHCSAASFVLMNKPPEIILLLTATEGDIPQLWQPWPTSGERGWQEKGMGESFDCSREGEINSRILEETEKGASVRCKPALQEVRVISSEPSPLRASLFIWRGGVDSYLSVTWQQEVSRATHLSLICLLGWFCSFPFNQFF